LLFITNGALAKELNLSEVTQSTPEMNESDGTEEGNESEVIVRDCVYWIIGCGDTVMGPTHLQTSGDRRRIPRSLSPHSPFASLENTKERERVGHCYCCCLFLLLS
jgi:hypothetical protein